MDEWKAVLIEASILKRLNLTASMITSTSWKVLQSPTSLALSYRRSPRGFIKLSFDWASKWNPGNAGFGGLFRDHETRTHLIYVVDCGYASNIETKFTVVKQGLLVAWKACYKRLVIDGNSQLVMDIVKKLSQGSHWEKLSHN